MAITAMPLQWQDEDVLLLVMVTVMPVPIPNLSTRVLEVLLMILHCTYSMQAPIHCQ